jgi:hypothetical protein
MKIYILPSTHTLFKINLSLIQSTPPPPIGQTAPSHIGVPHSLITSVLGISDERVKVAEALCSMSYHLHAFAFFRVNAL